MTGTGASGSERGSRLALALAGGGPEGAVYEIGALRALDEALGGIDFRSFDIYVGVSSGSLIAACLANGISTERLCQALLRAESSVLPFAPRTFFTPALREWFRRGSTVPRLTLEALGDFLRHPTDLSPFHPLALVSRALPLGLFDNEPIRAFLERVFRSGGRTDDFRRLRQKLFVIAADLDTGEAVRFGPGERDHVPISRAVQASTALPVLYPPVVIDGQHYVDGVLLKTLHASVALEEGADLLLCVNPIVPVDTRDAVRAGVMRRGKLAHRGLPTVLSQTFRTLVHSRLTVGMSAYQPRYPDRDVVLIEPSRDDYRMFFTNIFSFAERKEVCRHAYETTRQQLRERRDELGPVFERHGLQLRAEFLDGDARTPWDGIAAAPRPGEPSWTRRLDQTLSRLDTLLERATR